MQEDLSGVTAFIYNHTEEASYPHGVFAVQVSLLDSNGKYVKDATFQLSVSDNLIENETERNVDGRTTVKANDWNTRFRYAPSSPGSKTLTFTSGDFTKTLTIEVQ